MDLKAQQVDPSLRQLRAIEKQPSPLLAHPGAEEVKGFEH